jgi:methionyl-tRNA formyltransferase
VRVVFMGTPDFAVPCLQAIVDAGHDVVRVISQPDRPKGRGQKLTSPPVAVRARQLGIEVRQPRAVRSGGLRDALKALAPDVSVVVAYGRVLPVDVLAVPRYGSVNVHASLLPRWRGAAPIQWAIAAGDPISGVCTQRMEEGLDTGDVYLSRTLALDPRETAATLHDRLSKLGAQLAVETLADLPELVPTPQDATQATYAQMIAKADGAMDFARPAVELDRRLRAFTPWPGGFCETRGGRMKVIEARPSEGAGAPGTVLSTEPLVVACGEGALELVRVQAPGRKPVSGADYARGARISAGDTL